MVTNDIFEKVALFFLPHVKKSNDNFNSKTSELEKEIENSPKLSINNLANSVQYTLERFEQELIDNKENRH